MQSSIRTFKTDLLTILHIRAIVRSSVPCLYFPNGSNMRIFNQLKVLRSTKLSVRLRIVRIKYRSNRHNPQLFIIVIFIISVLFHMNLDIRSFSQSQDTIIYSININVENSMAITESNCILVDIVLCENVQIFILC